jgi:hypothetical protein
MYVIESGRRELGFGRELSKEGNDDYVGAVQKVEGTIKLWLLSGAREVMIMLVLYRYWKARSRLWLIS